jgi:hypothetical protein
MDERAHGTKWLATPRQLVGPAIQHGVGNLNLVTFVAALVVETSGENQACSGHKNQSVFVTATP